MGDVVLLSEARRPRRTRGRDGETSEPGSIALFTGVRIERWGEDEPDPRPTETRPTTPRRRRRRS